METIREEDSRSLSTLFSLLIGMEREALISFMLVLPFPSSNLRAIRRITSMESEIWVSPATGLPIRVSLSGLN